MKNKLILLLCCVLAQGCSKVDDYLLGKDNTPKPKPLKQVDSKVTIAKQWSVSVGKTNKSQEYLKLKPVVKDGVIYTADRSGIIKAVDKKTTAVIWSAQLAHPIVSGPSVSEGYVVVTTHASNVVVFNQATGKKLWQAKVSNEILSPPTIAHKKVIAKTIDGKVYAFDASNGKVLWNADHGSPNLILKASSSPLVLGDLVLIGFSDGKLDALEIDTGRVVWQRSIAYASGASDIERLVDIDADPIVQGNVAYLASYQGYVGALSLTDGQFIWRKPGSVYKNMLLAGNSLYFTDSDDVIWSLDKANGNVNWKQTALKARGLTEPVMAGSNLMVADKTGYLHVIGTQTGELLARSQLAAGISAAPSIAGKKLYVLTDNGMLNQISVS